MVPTSYLVRTNSILFVVSCQRIIVGVANYHTHKLSLPTIRESFNHKNLIFSNLRKSSLPKDSRYTVLAPSFANRKSSHIKTHTSGNRCHGLVKRVHTYLIIAGNARVRIHMIKSDDSELLRLSYPTFQCTVLIMLVGCNYHDFQKKTNWPNVRLSLCKRLHVAFLWWQRSWVSKTSSKIWKQWVAKMIIFQLISFKTKKEQLGMLRKWQLQIQVN